MSRDGRIAAGIFLVAAVTFGYFTGGAGWNQDAHFDLTRALVERQTLYVDGYDVNTGDLSPGTGGHSYINKPPMASLLAAIPYAFVFAAEKFLHAPIDDMTRTNRWIATALSIGLCGACIGPVLYLYGRRRIGASAPAALAVAAAVLFGTGIFPYSTMLFAQIPSALFLLLAVVLLSTRPVLAGLAAGLALSCFYVCGAAALILFIVACFQSRRAAARFAIGCLPWIVLMAVYQWLCLGSPFRTAVEASTPFTEKGSLFGVLRLPSLEALSGILVSPYRGLFFASPVLLFAVIGVVIMARRCDLHHDLSGPSGAWQRWCRCPSTSSQLRPTRCPLPTSATRSAATSSRRFSRAGSRRSRGRSSPGTRREASTRSPSHGSPATSASSSSASESAHRSVRSCCGSSEGWRCCSSRQGGQRRLLDQPKRLLIK
jgi:hypothetical protein